MDTKLKNYRYSVWFKLLAIILCIAGMLSFSYGLLQAPYFEDAIQNKEFKESVAGKDILQHAYSNISFVAFKYKDEENIKSGATLDPDEISGMKSNIEYSRSNELQQVENDFYSSVNQYQEYLNNQSIIIDNNGNVVENTDVISDIKNKDALEKIQKLKDKKDKDTKEINKKYDRMLGNVAEEAINRQLEDYKSQIKHLDSLQGIYYSVVQNGKTAHSNISDNNTIENYFDALPFSVRLTQSNWNSYFGGNSYGSYSIPADTTVYLGMSPDRYQTEVNTFKSNSVRGLTGLKTSGLGLLAFITGLIYLIYSAGRRTDKEGVHLISADIIYLDVALVVSVSFIVLCISQIIQFVPVFYWNNTRYNAAVIYTVLSVVVILGTLAGILFITMLVKRFKRHEVIKYTLLCKMVKWIFSTLHSLYVKIKNSINGVLIKSPLTMRLLLIFGAYAFLSLIFALIFAAGNDAAFIGFFGIVGINAVAIYFLLKNFKVFINIRDGAEKIRAGELTYNIPELGIPELRALAGTINQIADGLKNAVSSQVKAERMKAELITNVSHDLKTPLTSIITYVDLLKNEGLQSENAGKYLGIIDSKSQRLKSLTEDLFEAAKATSGNITVNFEKLNVASLISQGLGELSDKIETSGLIFRTNFPAENVYVNADGRLLWRVIENLLSNVFKYALLNSRVYIDVIQTAETVKIVVKNISAYELNVNADELMERFKRGDASRHSEGSGLGLSIAKSLTELQNGNFNLNIDGDLFKATIELPAVSQLIN